jgi:type I restriction-modification system DNA methylase subunit
VPPLRSSKPSLHSDSLFRHDCRIDQRDQSAVVILRFTPNHNTALVANFSSILRLSIPHFPANVSDMLVTFDTAFARVKELVANFRANESFYQSAEFSEAQARKDFIDKFFIALGWDVNHETQKNPYEQEVKVERNESSSQRRADYAFYLSPNFRDVHFFVEAKKPHSDFGSPENYFQTIRYGWGNKTPLAVLTNFDELHILDCRYKPNIGDTLSRVVRRFSYADYADTEKFSEIYWLFSCEAVANNSLAKFADNLPRPKSRTFRKELFKGGYQSIDESFLIELDENRETLAKAFKAKNPNLNSEQLTEVTQRALDRLVFIRFLEDKLIEPQRHVERFGADGGNAWEDFVASALALDRTYNGIVFKKHDILDAPGFQVDEKPFQRICEELSDPTSPYNFDAIPIHILGSIYERFLGKVIIADKKSVRLEEKPEVRKAGGVYYTPDYIVRYIVESTVGKLIDGKTPAQIAEMRFADIACGSGSFLLGVFDLLLRYHSKFYNDNPAKAKKGDCIKRDGVLHLSLQKKQDILRNNIYGVDIDRQAVEVAQLSLYLKLLEDETLASAHAFQTEFHYTLLPSLAKNIVCGNSLIGMDVLATSEFSDEEAKKLNPMDFEQRFPEIMKLGGFDVILGNPPWISLKGKFGNDIMPQCALDYLLKKFDGDTYRPNIYEFFVRQAVRVAKNGGYCSYIVPDRLGLNLQFEKTRIEILKTCSIESLIYKAKFPNVIADTLIFVFKKTPANESHKVLVEEYEREKAEILQSEYAKMPVSRFAYPRDIANIKFFAGIDSKPHLRRLDYFLNSSVGFIACSKTVQRYQTAKTQNIVFKGENIHRYSLTGNFWFQWKKSNLAGGTQDIKKLGTCPKILLRKTGAPIFAALDTHGVFPEQSLYFAFPKSGNPCDCKFYLAILNSHFFDFYYKNRLVTNADTTPQLKKVDLDSFPFPIVDFSKPADKTQHDKMVSLVEQMLAAKPQLAGAQSDKDKDFYENKCASLDRQIDALVYELYGLTADEIKIVEGAAA